MGEGGFAFLNLTLFVQDLREVDESANLFGRKVNRDCSLMNSSKTSDKVSRRKGEEISECFQWSMSLVTSA